MKPSNELFQLIKSLTKSEKRYFKLSSSLQSGEKNYMKLFDIIELQEEYDEPAIKQKFKKETFIKHLPSEKNHLYNLILKSLRGFYADKSAAAILQEQIRNIELLYNKALYSECSKIIRKAKKIAYDYEKFYFLLDIIDWEKRLSEEEFLRGNFKRDLDLILEEETECLEKLKNIAEYQKLYSHVNYAIRKGGYSRNHKEQKIIDEIANHPLITGKNTALSKKAATACYSIQGLRALTERDIEKSSINFKKVIKIMEANPFIMNELPKRYIKALNGVVYDYMRSRDWENCFIYIEKMRALKGSNGFSSMDIQLMLFTLTNNAELLAYLYSGDFVKAVDVLVPKILEGIQKFDGKINKEEEMLFYYNISRAYFGIADYKQSLKYINIVLNDSESGLRDDVYTFARLLNLIIHYELGNYDLLDYTIKSTKRYVTKSNRNYQFEAVFLKNIKNIIKVKQNELAADVFKNFKQNLEKVLTDPYERVALEYFDFISWLDCKIENKTCSEIKG
jgi:hypothetical protein